MPLNQKGGIIPALNNAIISVPKTVIAIKELFKNADTTECFPQTTLQVGRSKCPHIC